MRPMGGASAMHWGFVEATPVRQATLPPGSGSGFSVPAMPARDRVRDTLLAKAKARRRQRSGLRLGGGGRGRARNGLGGVNERGGGALGGLTPYTPGMTLAQVQQQRPRSMLRRPTSSLRRGAPPGWASALRSNGATSARGGGGGGGGLAGLGQVARGELPRAGSASQRLRRRGTDASAIFGAMSPAAQRLAVSILGGGATPSIGSAAAATATAAAATAAAAAAAREGGGGGSFESAPAASSSSYSSSSLTDGLLLSIEPRKG